MTEHSPYDGQFEPVTHHNTTQWRPRIDDLAIYGAHDEAAMMLSAPAEVTREWINECIIESVNEGRYAIERARWVK